MNAHHGAPVEVTGQVWELVLSYHMDPDNRAQITSLGSQHLYLQSHLASCTNQVCTVVESSTSMHIYRAFPHQGLG